MLGVYVFIVLKFSWQIDSFVTEEVQENDTEED